MRIEAGLRPKRMARCVKEVIRYRWNGTTSELRYRTFVLHPTKGWQPL